VSSDLRKLTSTRIREARTLLDAGEWSGAYYLAGYAIETGLKVCISTFYKKYQIVDPKIGKGVYTHNLIELVNLANLSSNLANEIKTDRTFAVQWAVVKDWNESSRYDIWSESDARDLYRAIKLRRHGVLRWVKRHW